MKIVAIVQARMTSTRLPGKVLMDLNGIPLLELLLNRVQKSKMIDEIVVAVPDEEASQPIITLCENLNIKISRGDELDVLSRFTIAAKASQADVIVRLCSDCPFIDPQLIDETIQNFLDGDFDYMNNIEQRSYPDGLDCEVFKASALYSAHAKAQHPKHREHVTTYIDGRIKNIDEKGDFRCGSINNDTSYGHLMWSVNTEEQLNHIRKLHNLLKDKENFNWLDVLNVEENT